MPLVTGEAALDNVRVIGAIDQSAAEDRPVTVVRG